MKYRIDTRVFPDGIIQQDLIQDHTSMVTRWIMDTREEGIRKSLIRLGWTPPDCDTCHGTGLIDLYADRDKTTIPCPDCNTEAERKQYAISRL